MRTDENCVVVGPGQRLQTNTAQAEAHTARVERSQETRDELQNCLIAASVDFKTTMTTTQPLNQGDKIVRQ